MGFARRDQGGSTTFFFFRKEHGAGYALYRCFFAKDSAFFHLHAHTDRVRRYATSLRLSIIAHPRPIIRADCYSGRNMNGMWFVHRSLAASTLSHRLYLPIKGQDP